ncbi:MAG TPA: lipopolysaccharide biosynthesis protein, partial [Polyangiaceae bacterium]|nr:lipopolysaccharide biosynthesis protein [Polyangiaceae bacterium]
MTKQRDSLFTPRSSAEVARRALRGGALSVAAQAVRGVVEGGGTLLLARTLAPAEFGLVDMIVSITGVVDLLKDFGLSSATIQRHTIDHAQVSLLFWINCGVGLALTLIIMALAPVLALLYSHPELRALTWALSLNTLLGALSVQHQALLRRDLRFGALAAIDTASAFLSTGAALWVAYAGFGAWALVARQLMRNAAQALAAWQLCSWRPTRPARADVRELLRFGGHVSTFQIVNYLERNADNILIGRFAGARALGFYTKAYGLMRVPLDQINNFSNVMVPALSRLLSDPARYLQAYRSVAALFLLLTIPLAPLALYSADWFIPALLGEPWRGSVAVFRWLALALLVRPIMNSGGWLFLSQGRTFELRRWGFLAAGLAITSFLIGLPWGSLGVAAAYSVLELTLRGPLWLLTVGRSGPVHARHVLAAAAPAWTAAAAIALT